MHDIQNIHTNFKSGTVTEKTALNGQYLNQDRGS